MEDLMEQLIEMRAEVKEMKQSCAKMDNHIDFIEIVYSKLRAPLTWVLNKWNSGIDYLPMIRIK